MDSCLMKRAGPLTLTFAAAASWAAATVLTKVALRGLDPLDLLAIELFSSALAMLCLLAIRGRLRLPANWPLFAALGVLEPGLSFGLFDVGLAHTGAADGAILIASQSLFGVTLARLFLGERVSATMRVAVFIGFGGSALVGLAETGHGANLFGDFLILIASAAAATNGVGVRRFSADADNLAATATQLVAAAVFAVPAIATADIAGRGDLAHAEASYVVAAVATGLLGGAVPFLAFNRAIRDLTVAHAGVVLNLVPILATGAAVLVLGEHLHWTEITGGALVIASAAATSLPEGLLRRRAHRPCAGGDPVPC
jgi:drug/metabolite transporter (DMT)-like permease